MNSKKDFLFKTFVSFLLFSLIGVYTYGQEKADPALPGVPKAAGPAGNNSSQDPAQFQSRFFFLLPLGYDFSFLGEQAVHSPAAGAGFLIGKQDLSLIMVERRFYALALYQPLVFTKTPAPGVPKMLHQIDAIFDGRLERQQLLFIFKSSSDKPVSGGLNTFRTAAGWGYEVIRRPGVSLILGAVLGLSDFNLTLPSGTPIHVLPLPLVRFGIDTQWFTSSFDFITGPNFEFAIAPKEKIRFTGEMRMDNYRSIADLVCEYTLWYRFFANSNARDDFAGIGAGFKNDLTDFNLSRDVAAGRRAKTFELRQTSVFAVLDFALVKIKGGWVFDSAYLLDGKKAGSPGRGIFLSVQGIIPISIR